MDAVTPILVDRAREPEGLRRMISISLAVHVVGTAIFLLMPAPSLRDDSPREVMTISLGGAQGVNVGGHTSMGGQAKEEAPLPTRPVPMPAPSKAPEMVLPRTATKPETPRPTTHATETSRPRPAPKAAEAQAGSTPIDTSGHGVAYGLATGGNGTNAYLDVQSFCCPDYLSTMIQLIQQNWSGKQNVAGQTLMKFTIERDGRITNVQMERSSGYFALDQTSQRALLLTRQLPPLPPAFTEPNLTVHLNFQYER